MLDNFFSLIATINIKQYNYGSIVNAIWINMHQPSQDIIVNLFTKSTRTLQKAHPLQVQAHPHDSAILLWRMDRGGSAGVPRAVSSPRGPLAGMPWVSCPRIDDLYLKCLRVATLWPSRPPWPSGDWRGAWRARSLALLSFWKAARQNMPQKKKLLTASGGHYLTWHGYLHFVLVNREHELTLTQTHKTYNGIKSLYNEMPLAFDNHHVQVFA